MYKGKYSLLNDIERWRSCSGCVNKIRLWSLRRDDRSGVLIGAGGTRRSDWLARVDCWRSREKRSIARVRGAIDCTRAGTSGSQLLQAGLTHARHSSQPNCYIDLSIACHLS